MNWIVLICKSWSLWASTRAVRLTMSQPYSSSPWIKVTHRHLITFLSARAVCEGWNKHHYSCILTFFIFLFLHRVSFQALITSSVLKKSSTLPLYSSHARHHSRSSVGCLEIPRSSESSDPWTRSLNNLWFPPVQTSSVGPGSSWVPLQPEVRGGGWNESL